MPNPVLEFIFKVKDEASSQLNSIKSKLLDQLGITERTAKAYTAAGGALIAYVGMLKKLADDTLEYANSVRELTVAIGATPEEASKLIQVADDVNVSSGQLQRALEGAIRKGISPTIEGISQLSDEYLKLQPGVERTKFLMDNFGRSGTDIARVMELGSRKIREMGEEVENTARVMDQEALDAAENYRMALDNFGDTLEDIKLTVGELAIPELTEDINGLAAVVGNPEFIKFLEWIVQLNNLIEKFSINPFTRAMMEAQEETRKHSQALLDAYYKTRDADMALQGYKETAEETSRTEDILNASIQAQKFEDLERDAMGAGEGLERVHAAAKQLPAVFEEITNAVIAAQAIDAINKAFEDKQISREEYLKLLKDVAINLQGLPGEQVKASQALDQLNQDFITRRIGLDEYLEKMYALKRSIDDLPTKKRIDIEVAWSQTGAGDTVIPEGLGIPKPRSGGGGGGGGSSGGGDPGRGVPRAFGGPVSFGQPYSVHGGETFVPHTSGQIVPGAGGNLIVENINVYAAPGADAAALTQEILIQLSEEIRIKMLAGGLGGF